ncbi:ABC transporter substrate-binding protein [Arcobacteraceae bacterium]|nr:ABC transporter substrate-binding protein [Arcobacteraceae bacterium]
MKNIFTHISKIWIVVFIILVIVSFVSIQLTAPAAKKELSIATGSIGSDSYAYAMSYKALLEEEGVTLNVIPTQGSLDTIGYLDSKKVDIGFVHSGILLNKREYNFESLASVYYEPLWIFYRNDGYGLNYLIEATGKNVGISITNDGTYDLALKLSKANGLIKSVKASYLYDNEALAQFKDKKIDIFVTLATKDNSNIQELLADPTIELMSLKRINAYTQKFDYLLSLKLYEGSINLYKNLPSTDVNLLSTTQNLVCNPDIPGELLRIFLKKVQEIHGQKTFFQNADEFLNSKHIDTVINDDAELYLLNGESWLETIFPYWIASNIDRLKLLIIPLIWLIIPLFKSIVPLYIFTIRSKIFRWYDKIDELNKKIEQKENKDDIIQEIKNLKEEINSKTKVPLSYKGEFYNLILHLELLENKINKI